MASQWSLHHHRGCPPSSLCRSELKEVMAPPEVQLPNGMAWREGSPLVYFVDSGEESITEYATDEQVGLKPPKFAGMRMYSLQAVTALAAAAHALPAASPVPLCCNVRCCYLRPLLAGYPTPPGGWQAAGPLCGPLAQRAQGSARWHDH